MELLKSSLEENNIQIIKKNDYINHFKDNKPKEGVYLVDFIEFYTNKKSKRRSETYVEQYKTVSNHINRFSEVYDAEIFTNSVTDGFLDDFIGYL